jgi:hypothetical protein
MEKLYKLKKDARHFFQGSTLYDDVSKDIQPQKWWDDKGIHPLLLDEVSLVYVDYGHESVSESGIVSRTIKGWSNPEKSSKYNFAIVVSDPGGDVYRSVKIEEVMDQIQLVLDKYFKSRY